MISNRRLFAGLTSLISNLWLSHFCSSEPSGIRESRTKTGLLLARRSGVGVWTRRVDQTELHRDGEREVADEDHGREDLRERSSTLVVLRVVDAETLEQRPRPVVQVERERDHREDVDDRDDRTLQAVHEVVVRI